MASISSSSRISLPPVADDDEQDVIIPQILGKIKGQADEVRKAQEIAAPALQAQYAPQSAYVISGIGRYRGWAVILTECAKIGLKFFTTKSL